MAGQAPFDVEVDQPLLEVTPQLWCRRTRLEIWFGAQSRTSCRSTLSISWACATGAQVI